MQILVTIGSEVLRIAGVEFHRLYCHTYTRTVLPCIAVGDDLLLPFVTEMVNASLRQGRLPTSQKHAVVTPLLKKPGLDTADMASFRPVSNLTYMSKVVERADCLSS